MKSIEIICTVDPRDALNVKTQTKSDYIEIIYRKVLEFFSGNSPVSVEKKFDSFNAVFNLDTDVSCEKLESALKSVSEEYSTKDIHITISEKAGNSNTATSNGKEDQAGGDGEDAAEESGAQQAVSKPEENTNKAIDDIRLLVGMDELKSWAESVEALAENAPSEQVLHRILFSMSYLISIDPGNGCTTMLECMGNLLLKYLPKKKLSIREYVLDAGEDSPNIGSVQNEIDSVNDNDKLYLFALHLDKCQDFVKTDEWTEFLKKCWEKNRFVVFAFIVPVLEQYMISSLHDNINDILTNKVICVNPMTNNDYICFFEKYFSNYDLKIDESAHDVFLEKLAEEKNDGKFHGINTIYKVCDEVLYNKYLKNAEGVYGGTVTKEDVLSTLKTSVEKGASESGYTLLDNMVSLDEVKAKIREIVASVKLYKKMDINSAKSMHMMFCGSPGTGKTETARIIGKIFCEEQLLSKGSFTEVSRKDLVGKYVGHTAPKTAAVCRNALGGVLFIDEAYMLDGGSENDFGKEAISTLIAEMENNRDNLIVIFAGYTKLLERLFDLNPGLRDRIPYKIEFKNYSRDELKEIFYTKIPKEFSYSDDFSESVENYFSGLQDNLLEDDNFSNARFVRNIVERVVSKAALRLQAEPQDSKEVTLVKSDFDLAVADADFSSLNAKKSNKPIGF